MNKVNYLVKICLIVVVVVSFYSCYDSSKHLYCNYNPMDDVEYCRDIPTAHYHAVTNLAVSDDNSLVVSSDGDEIFLWEIDKNDEKKLSFSKLISFGAYSRDDINFPTVDRLSLIPAMVFFPENLIFLSISPNNEYIFAYERDARSWSVEADGRIYGNRATLFNILDNKIEWIINNGVSDSAFFDFEQYERRYKVAFRNADFSPSGDLLALTYLNRIEIINTKDASLVQNIPFSNNVLFNYSTFSPDGKSLFVLSDNNSSFLWDIDLANKKQIFKLNGSGNFAEFSASGDEIVVNFIDASPAIINLKNNQIASMDIGKGYKSIHFAQSDTKRFLVPNDSDRWSSIDVRAFDYNTTKIEKVYKHQDYIIGAVDVSNNGKYIVIGYGNGEIKISDINSDGIFHKKPPTPFNVEYYDSTLSWTIHRANNENVKYFHVSFKEKNAQEWVTKTFLPERNHSHPQFKGWPQSEDLPLKQLTEYTVRIKAEGYNGKFGEYVELEVGTQTSFNFDDGDVTAVMSNGNLFAVGSTGGYVNLFKVASGSKVRTAIGVTNKKITDKTSIRSIDINTRNSQVIAGTQEGHIFTINVNAYGEQTSSKLTSTSRTDIDIIKYSHNDTKFAFNGGNSVGLMNANNHKIHTLEAHSSKITAIVFSEDDEKIISSSLNGLLKIDNSETYENILTIDTQDEVLGMDVSREIIYTTHQDKVCIIRAWSLLSGDRLKDYSFDTLYKELDSSYYKVTDLKCSIRFIDVTKDGKYALLSTKITKEYLNYSKEVEQISKNFVLLWNFEKNGYSIINWNLYSKTYFSKDEKFIIFGGDTTQHSNPTRVDFFKNYPIRPLTQHF